MHNQSFSFFIYYCFNFSFKNIIVINYFKINLIFLKLKKKYIKYFRIMFENFNLEIKKLKEELENQKQENFKVEKKLLEDQIELEKEKNMQLQKKRKKVELIKKKQRRIKQNDTAVQIDFSSDIESNSDNN